MKNIQVGDKLYHTLLKQWLTVAADEQGPAYTGKEFADDEISFTHAQDEYKNGRLLFGTPKQENNHDMSISYERNEYCELGYWHGEKNNIDIRISSSNKDAKKLALKIIECWNGWDELKSENERLSALNKELMLQMQKSIVTIKAMRVGRPGSYDEAAKESITAMEALLNTKP